jgi:hypothetical protein
LQKKSRNKNAPRFFVLKAGMTFQSSLKINPMRNEQVNELIRILGERSIEKAFEITGDEKISFAFLRSRVRKRYIIQALELGGSFAAIAKQYAVSRMTVYRIFHAEIKFRNLKSFRKD